MREAETLTFPKYLPEGMDSLQELREELMWKTDNKNNSEVERLLKEQLTIKGFVFQSREDFLSFINNSVEIKSLSTNNGGSIKQYILHHDILILQSTSVFNTDYQTNSIRITHETTYQTFK